MSLTPVPSGLDVQVNTYTISSQVVPSVAALSDGGFVVTWTSLNQDGSDYGTYGQRYASNGKAIGDEFRLNQIAAGNQIAPAESSVPLATLTDGRLVQVWEGYGSEEVFFRLIDMSWGDNGLPGLSGVTITGTAGNDTVDATTTVPGQPLPTEEDDVIYGLAGADNLMRPDPLCRKTGQKCEISCQDANTVAVFHGLRPRVACWGRGPSRGR